MAHKSSSSSPAPRPVRSSGWLLNLASFIAVICIGVSLILSKIGWFSKIAGALTMIAQVISYLVLIVISCFYIVKRKNIWLWLVWAVSVVLIVLFFVL